MVIVIILTILSHNSELRYSEDKTSVIIIPQKGEKRGGALDEGARRQDGEVLKSLLQFFTFN